MAETIARALQDKLRAIQQERTRLQERLTALDALEQAVQIVLADEERALPSAVQLPLVRGQERTGVVGRTAKSAFVVKALWDGGKALPQLTEEAQAENVDFAGKDPGRALHFALVGLARFGYTAKDGEVWSLTDAGRAAAIVPHANGSVPVEVG